MEEGNIVDTAGSEAPYAGGAELTTIEGAPAVAATEPEQVVPVDTAAVPVVEEVSQDPVESQTIPYKRFKEVNDKYRETEGKLTEAQQAQRAWQEVTQLQGFNEFLGQALMNQGKPAVNPIDQISFTNEDGTPKTDKQIALEIKAITAAEIKGELGGEIQQLKNTLAAIASKETERATEALFNDKERFPGAADNKDEIKTFMQQTGLDFEKAYFATQGKKLADAFYQQGLKRTQEKLGTATPSGKSAQVVPQEIPKFKNVHQARQWLKDTGQLP